jgi:adhesin transport system membrane fusion protein
MSDRLVEFEYFQRDAIRQSRITVYLSFFAIVAFASWAYFAEINEITRGTAKVIPASRVQTIQSLEGGILSRIMVREGDIVEAGQVLLELDSTQSRASYLASEAQVDTITAEVARLEAEVLEQEVLSFGPEPSNVELSEIEIFKARRLKLKEALDALNQQMDSLNEQISLLSPLVESGSAGRLELLQLQQKRAEVLGKISEVKNSYVQDAYKELSEKRSKLSALQQELVKKEDDLTRTAIRSPVDGRVNDILITTLGGVILSGEHIMQITPIDDNLIFETKISPRDVAFIAPGMPASVKITAYDFTTYGDLEGRVTQISEDTVQEESGQGLMEYYRVMVETEQDYIDSVDGPLAIRPGMVAEVDIISGNRTILNYLLRPLLSASLR